MELLQLSDVICGLFSYTDIQAAARDLAAREPHKSDSAVQKMKFSNRWCKALLLRWRLARSRVTTVSKQRPTVAEVQQRLLEIQTTLTAGRFPLTCVFSADQTAIFFRAPFKNTYVHRDARRAPAFHGTDENARFTALLCADASGICAPSAFVLKASTAVKDQTRSTMLKNVARELNVGRREDWELGTWTRTAVPAGTNGEPVDILRKYLRNKVSGDIVWAQNRGWMDGPGLLMWCELLLAPLRQKRGHDLAVIMDHFSSHVSSYVSEFFKERGVVLMFLPPNMTDVLQPMDLMVNGPLKEALRLARADQLRPQIQQHRSFMLTHPGAEFKPQLPNRVEAVRACIRAIRALNDSPKMRGSIGKCFRDVGLAPVDVCTESKAPRYVGYTSHSVPRATLQDAVDALPQSELLVRVDVCSREDEVKGASPSSWKVHAADLNDDVNDESASQLALDGDSEDDDMFADVDLSDACDSDDSQPDEDEMQS